LTSTTTTSVSTTIVAITKTASWTMEPRHRRTRRQQPSRWIVPRFSYCASRRRSRRSVNNARNDSKL